jgi:hypothetical protein
VRIDQVLRRDRRPPVPDLLVQNLVQDLLVVPRVDVGRSATGAVGVPTIPVL